MRRCGYRSCLPRPLGSRRQSLIELTQLRNDRRITVLISTESAIPSSHASPQLRTRREDLKLVCEAQDVAGRDEASALILIEDLAQRTDPSANDRKAGGHRFQHGKGKPLADWGIQTGRC